MKHTSSIFLVINGLAFYIYWWLCFFGAANQKFYYGPIVGIIYMIFHFLVIENKAKEFKYIIICFLFGFIVETLFFKLNFISYKGILTEKYAIAPFWIVILWTGFGTTVYHSFKWILGKYRMCFILGAVFTPIFYISADKIGAISFNYSLLTSYFVLSFIWGISLLLLVYIADHIT